MPAVDLGPVGAGNFSMARLSTMVPMKMVQIISLPMKMNCKSLDVMSFYCKALETNIKK
jgi:hypothetical protein